MRRELLIGCGSRRDRRLSVQGREVTYSNPGPTDAWSHLTTLDHNADHRPDVVHDLEALPYPFEDDTFDEVHAYEVLEHLGSQGDWRAFFDQFSELYRILRPGGLLCATVPAFDSPWAWGDPSHRRIISSGTLVFLSQAEYAKQVGVTPMSDFRFYYRGDFEPIAVSQIDAHGLGFVLRAVKPARLAHA